jgi:photosystem II stability/assembly factor-like uncharacterized protein
MHRCLRPIPALLLACTPLFASDAPPASWQSVGWGGGAYYFTVSWHPTDGNVLYMGSDCAGLYRSDNSAKQWNFVNNGITDYAVYSTAVSPASPDLIYALTDGGLHKSTDRAKTWTFVADSAKAKLDIVSKRDGSVRAIAIDPKNADVVYVGSRTGKLWKTTDGAKTWAELDYREIFPKPAPPPAYTGISSLHLNYDASAAGKDPMGRISKFFGQGDKAKDWSAFKRMTVRFLVPTDAPAVQAQLVVQSGDAWKWQQGDWIDGKPGTWVEVPLDLSKLSDLNSVRMIHFAVRTFQPGWKGGIQVDAMALHTDPAGTLAAGAVADGTSTVLVADWEKDAEGWAANNKGDDYRKITGLRQGAEKTGGDVLSSVAVAGDGAVYITNTKLGALRSDDAGLTWVALQTPKSAMCISTTPDPAVLWLAADKAGALRSTDRGTTWTPVALEEAPNPKLSVREIVTAPSRPQRIYAIATIDWGGYLYISDDAGTTWTRSTKVRNDVTGNPTNPDEVGANEFAKGTSNLSSIKNIAVNPQNPDELFIAGNWRNIYSGDGGKTLEERSTGADNTCTTDIQFLGNKTYATAMDEGLLVTENDGKLWRQLWPLKYDVNISGHFWRVRVAKVDGQDRIVTTASPWQSFGNPKCANRAYYSADGGASFTISNAGLPDYVPNVNCMWGRSFPRALAQHPTDPNILYLGMDGDPEPSRNLPGGGIFRSADGGKTWTRCATQPGGLRLYYGLVVDPSNPKRLYYSVCGNGGGAWKSEDEGATWTHIFKNEPWPFNLEVSATGTVLVGGNNLWSSSDQGATWKKLTTFGSEATIVGIATDPADSQRMWLSRTSWDSSSTGGIFRTTDGGASWHEITGDIPFRKPQILRYNAATHDLWAAGVGIFKIAQ